MLFFKGGKLFNCLKAANPPKLERIITAMLEEDQNHWDEWGDDREATFLQLMSDKAFLSSLHVQMDSKKGKKTGIIITKLTGFLNNYQFGRQK